MRCRGWTARSCTPTRTPRTAWIRTRRCGITLTAGPDSQGARATMGGVRRAPLVALTAVAALLMLGASACTGNSSQVALGTADRGSVTEVVDASATVTAKAAATLTAPSAGTLAGLMVSPGQSVTAGQVVAVISAPAAQQQLNEASAALAAASGGGGG